MKLTIMKHISFILICLFSFIGCSITKPSVTATKAPLMIINGSFFRGYPEKSPVNRLFWQGLMKDEVYGTFWLRSTTHHSQRRRLRTLFRSRR